MDLQLASFPGLSNKEAEKRLLNEGFNELPSQREKNLWQILRTVVKDPMIALLIAAGIVYFFLGDPKEALMLVFFIFVVLGITVYQEKKTERALQALKNLASPKALVIRSKKEQKIPGREVVKGDILILREGDRIPADALILRERNFMVDESILTGESLPVKKKASRQELKPGRRLNMHFAYSGTVVVQGQAVVKVVATGLETEMGKIGKSLEAISEEEMLLRKETTKIAKVVGIVALIVCLAVSIIFLARTGNILASLLPGITLGMSLVPEEFGVILVIFLTLGAWRISKHRVLTRNTASIETLGAATVLCVDKTGTLTHNRMSLDSVYSFHSGLRNFEHGKKLDEHHRNVLQYGLWASQKEPFDPIEKEIKKTAESQINFKEGKILKEYLFTKKITAVTHVVETDKGIVVACKGSPESVLAYSDLKESEKEKVLKKAHELAKEGSRILAVAKSELEHDKFPKKQEDFKFKFLGLLAFSDPIRDSVSPALSECYKSGIRVCMITGDFPETAKYVARKIGLKNPEKYLTGGEIEEMDQDELIKKIRGINIFARIMPGQKLKIVRALKADGEVVAMTGDGVNDAPALKAAHIGIAMGERGTDVARESSDLILLDDDFSSIVAAIKLGRRIYDNLKKAIIYVIAIHVPIAGMSLFPVLLAMPLVLFPAQIAFLELFINPACSTIFEEEKEEGDIMERAPRDIKKSILGKADILTSLLQGSIIFLVVFLIYLMSLFLTGSEEKARSFTFAAIVFSNLLLILTNLSWSESVFSVLKKKNNAIYVVVTGALVLLLLVFYVDPLREIFRFGPINVYDLMLAFFAACLSISWFEVFKLLKRT